MGQDWACPSFAPWPTLTAAMSTPYPAATAASPSTCASQPAPRTTGSIIPRIELPHARPRHRNQTARRAQPSRNDHVPKVVGASCAPGPGSRTLAGHLDPNGPRQLGISRSDSLARRASHEPRRPDPVVREPASSRTPCCGAPTATLTKTSATSATAAGWTGSGGTVATCPRRVHLTIIAAKSKSRVARTMVAGTSRPAPPAPVHAHPCVAGGSHSPGWPSHRVARRRSPGSVAPRASL